MNKLFQIDCAECFKSLSWYIAVSCLIITVTACSVVQPTPPVSAPPYEDTPSPTPAPVPSPPPTIASISQSPTKNGARTIKIKGSGFDKGVFVEIYSASGKYIGSGILSGKLHSNQLTVKLPDLKPGKYTVKVKTTDGRFSNATTLTIPKPVPQSQCTGNFSEKPKVLYLGGGDAEKLFERYLSQNSGVEDKLPYTLKVKFYEKKETELILQTVSLGEFEDLFVESRKDFLHRIKKRLNGKVAELTAILADDAARENADYFQCP